MFTKTMMIALATVSIAATALPAYADSSDRNGDGSQQTQIFRTSEAATFTALRGKGVNATSVEQWGQLVKAEVLNADGSTSIQFFHPGTFNQAD